MRRARPLGGRGRRNAETLGPNKVLTGAEELVENPPNTFVQFETEPGGCPLSIPHRKGGISAGTEPDQWIRESYSRILATCVYAGLAPAEADDVAQDIWLWLLRHRIPLTLSMPWLSAVARNFILRYRRRSYRQAVREGRPLEAVPEPQTSGELEELEVNELLDRVAGRVTEMERKVLQLIRRGHTLAEAARLLGIPRGSRAYYHQRLIACARRELGLRAVIPIQKGPRRGSDTREQ